MLRFSLYAMTQPMQFTIFYGGDPGESVRIKRTGRRESVRAACRRRCRQAASDH